MNQDRRQPRLARPWTETEHTLASVRISGSRHSPPFSAATVSVALSSRNPRSLLQLTSCRPRPVHRLPSSSDRMCMPGAIAGASATVAYRLDGGHKLRVIERSRDTEGDRQIARPDEDRVDVRHREELVDAFERDAGFDLQHHEHVRVHVRDGLGDRDRLVVELRRGEPEPARAHGRKASPADGLREQLRRLDAREQDALGAAVERARDQRVLQVRHAHDRAQTGAARHAHQILQRLEAERAMLGVEEHPVEPGGGERPDGVRRPELKTTAAQLYPTLFESLLHRIRAHSGDHTRPQPRTGA